MSTPVPSSNLSPEQQEAYREQLDEQIDSIDSEIEYFEETLDSHLHSINRVKKWLTSYPAFAGILAPFVNRYVAQNEANISATQNNIALLQQQRTALIENAPVGPVTDATKTEVKADELAKHPRAEGPDAQVPEDPES